MLIRVSCMCFIYHRSEIEKEEEVNYTLVFPFESLGKRRCLKV